MDKKYIPVEEIVKHHGDVLRKQYVDEYAIGFKNGLLAALSYSTAAVAPVKHGVWKNINGVTRCSECEYVPPHNSSADSICALPYCAVCGAKWIKLSVKATKRVQTMLMLMVIAKDVIVHDNCTATKS